MAHRHEANENDLLAGFVTYDYSFCDASLECPSIGVVLPEKGDWNFLNGNARHAVDLVYNGYDENIQLLKAWNKFIFNLRNRTFQRP